MKIYTQHTELGSEALEGLMVAVPQLCRVGSTGVVLRRPVPGCVSVISGGGSGHEPAHVGLVGDGLLTGAVAGAVFSSPSTDEVLAALRAITGPEGTLVVIKNYTGDRLHFGLAIELAKSEGLLVETVVVGDDCALLGQQSTAGRRGLAGTVLVHKVAGAAAKSGLSLTEVKRIAQAAADALGTVGVGFSGCTLPATNAPAFHFAEDEMELGLGIHGEPGIARVKRYETEGLAQMMVNLILHSDTFSSPKDVLLLINNLGSSTTLELYALCGKVISYVESRGFPVKKMMIGSFLTSLDMNGVSVTLMALQSDFVQYLDAPVKVVTPWSIIDREQHDSDFSRIVEKIGQPESSPSEGNVTSHGTYDFEKYLLSICRKLKESAALLTQLDSQVGDGDLGINLAHLSDTLEENMSSIRSLTPPEFLKKIGVFCRRMGGSFGALLGILLVSMSNHYQSNDGTDLHRWNCSLRGGIESLCKTADTHAGDCTMIDALLPTSEALAKHDKENDTVELRVILESLSKASSEGAEATKAMVAKRGRASYIVDRSKGIADPGAVAVSLIFSALLQSVQG